ncbi:MAG: hypothetical protein WA673_00555 [Candidatus Acidiferrales bacterium]
MADIIQQSREQRLGGVASCYGVRAISEVIDTATVELFPRARFRQYDEAFGSRNTLKARQIECSQYFGIENASF